MHGHSPTPTIPGGLLSVDAACAYLAGISADTLAGLVKSAVLREVRIGRRKLYRPVDLEACIEMLPASDDDAQVMARKSRARKR
jgi:hypothetical protein